MCGLKHATYHPLLKSARILGRTLTKVSGDREAHEMDHFKKILQNKQDLIFRDVKYHINMLQQERLRLPSRLPMGDQNHFCARKREHTSGHYCTPRMCASHGYILVDSDVRKWAGVEEGNHYIFAKHRKFHMTLDERPQTTLKKLMQKMTVQKSLLQHKEFECQLYTLQLLM